MDIGTSHNKVLYLTYNGLCQPLGQSQVIPYLVGLSREGHAITVLSFEHRYERHFTKEQDIVKAKLAQTNIKWIALKYHKYPRFFSSLYDIIHGIAKALFFFLREPYGIVHARGHVPGMMGLVLKKILKTKFIFDIRGMMAEEKVDAGQWTYRSIGYKLTKLAEREMLKNADEIVVLTERIKPYLRVFTYITAPITVIPTCVDTNRFPEINIPYGDNMRMVFGLSDRLVIVYSGSLGTWYLFEQMAEFFKAAKDSDRRAFFLILNRNEHKYAKDVLKRYGINDTDYMIKSVSPNEVHEYLWVSDIGLSFIKPAFSKQSSSPTKLAEYLACGLPVIANAGVGDVEDILGQSDTGAIVYAFDDDEYKRAFEQAMGLVNDPDFKQRAYKVVKDTMSVEVGVQRYKGIYERL
ncbi:MAG: glycosyltransferase family 4 protein [Deltaproteobacteria bacterium]|nr:glycosyltransferase family 4 protein [Deltaproteobacteria bacterium]